MRVSSSLKSVVQVKIKGKSYIILSLRINFGGTSGIADFYLFSDIICDTINDILSCKSWNEKEICSDFVKKIPPAEVMDESIPFGEDADLSVEVPVEDLEMFDVYIEDFIRIIVYINNNKSRLDAAPYMVIFVHSRIILEVQTIS